VSKFGYVRADLAELLHLVAALLIGLFAQGKIKM
jgi:hypothetical protein